MKAFSERDVPDAIELRGTLEGLAARLAAERGAAPVVLREARDLRRRGSTTLLRQPALDDEAVLPLRGAQRAVPRAAGRDGRQRR